MRENITLGIIAGSGGLPRRVIDRARELLTELEREKQTSQPFQP